MHVEIKYQRLKCQSSLARTSLRGLWVGGWLAEQS